MTKIDRYIETINEELDGAKMYAEFFIEYQKKNPNWSRMFSEMATQELTHAEYIKTMAEEFAEGLPWMPEEAKDKWEHCMRHYGEKVAVVKLMLSK